MGTKHGLSLEDRFWSKVDKRGPDECWEWQASLLKSGYAWVYVGGGRRNRIMKSAHIIAYELTNGPTNGLHVLHTCDNPSCCNPKHLFLGTHQDNMDDKTEKDRQAKGENNGRAKLTEDNAIEIRQRYITGEYTQANLANMYGVSQSQIYRIVSGREWKYIPTEE